MAGFVTFDMHSLEKAWSTANWVFTGFIDHVLSLAGDVDVVHELTICKHHQNVDLKDMEDENPEIFHRVIDAFQKTCTRVIAGELSASVDGAVLDEESQTQYREEVSKLAKLLEQQSSIT